MSTPIGRSPAQMSPLARDGKSLDVRALDVSGGLLSNIDEMLRPNTKAKVLRNFHQFSRGRFSSSGGGWTRDCLSSLGNGTDSTLDFGLYLDALGNQYLMTQVGGTLYNYDTVAHNGVAVSGMTGLSATQLPCIRPAAPTSNTSTPFSIYCNGLIEPKKIYNATAGQAPNASQTLGFDNGFRTITVTITATGVLGTDSHVLVVTAGNLTKSPATITYKTVAADTLTSIAQALVNLLNANLATTSTIGYTASSSGAVITLQIPATYASGFTLTTSNTGTAASTVGAVSGLPTFPGVFNGLTYTKPALCTPFQSRVAYTAFANDGASGNAVAQMLLISALADAESFKLSTPAQVTDAWSIPIPPICGRPKTITSLKLSTNVADEVLVIGCTKGVCVVRGNDTSTFRLEILTTQFGMPSNRAIVQLDNALVFMSTDGFRYYTGTNDTQNLLTEQAPGVIDIFDQILLIDRKNWSKAHAVHHPDTQEIWFWVPYKTDGGICKHAFVCNYNTADGNPIWYNVDNTSCNASIEFNSTFYGGNETGLIQKWYGVNHYDDISGNKQTQTVTITGSTLNGATISVQFTNATLVGTPVTALYTQQAGDTVTTAAAGLAAAINANTNLTDFGVSATSSAGVITIAYPTTVTIAFAVARSGGFNIATAAGATTATAQNILPGAEITFSLIGVGNPAQFCSIRSVVICTGGNDQKFLINAAAYELMDDGSTRKQQQQPVNFTLQSVSPGQTVLAPASPNQWTLNASAFPQTNSKFLSDYVPQGHGRFWEFSIAVNDTSHNCDFTSLSATISIGGMRI